MTSFLCLSEKERDEILGIDRQKYETSEIKSNLTLDTSLDMSIIDFLKIRGIDNFFTSPEKEPEREMEDEKNQNRDLYGFCKYCMEPVCKRNCYSLVKRICPYDNNDDNNNENTEENKINEIIEDDNTENIEHIENQNSHVYLTVTGNSYCKFCYSSNCSNMCRLAYGEKIYLSYLN